MIAGLLVDVQRYPLTADSGRRFADGFASGKYLRLPGFFTPRGFDLLRGEVERLARIAIRRDLQMAGSGGTGRHMSTLGGDLVAEYSTILPRLYRDPELLDFLAGAAGEPVLVVPDPVENHVLNILHEVGDLHGGHIDTYAFAFNIFIESPPADGGGVLEFVPGSVAIEDLDSDRVQRVAHDVGDCYFLKTDEAVHRVAPLTRAGRRTIINLAYANPATIDLQSYSSSQLYASPKDAEGVPVAPGAPAARAGA